MRHKACNLCRERKVRCDGDQPACEKCRGSGDTCVYSPVSKLTKAHLAETIESLRDRIDNAETFFVKQQKSHMTPIERPVSEIQPVTAGDPRPFSAPAPSSSSIVGSLDQYFPSPHRPYTRECLAPLRELLDTDIFTCDPSPSLNLETWMPTKEENLLFHQSNNYHAGQMPTLQEIRAINSTSSPSLSSLYQSESCGCDQAKEVGRILQELKNFSSAIFHTQAEIAGISSVIAEYLAWIRNVPRGSKTSQEAAVLSTLEARVRELHEMADQQHWAAWRRMLERLELHGDALGVFEAEAQKRSAKIAQYYQSNYDAQKTMNEQRPAWPIQD
ncbi:uncharacterized protein N7479_005170 [Penicillium vulpinum]|uniref:uncharacterized protein n=1 Tax=Penicillium vulpinum TaxID=29845 RepID=UPI0025474DC6|nr:uncharacterized protein N7479_005170 [Penicillium vulpinum]KAJ5958020.1 hypothetical protein N7479_005170 [Penicillium vulpinum]